MARPERTGIAPASVPAFIAAQLAGAALAAGCIAVLYPTIGDVADRTVLPRTEEPA